MNFRISMLVIELMIGNTLGVEAQVIDNDATSVIEESGQSAEILEQPLATSVPGQFSREYAQEISQQLNRFEVALGGPALCGDNCTQYFLEDVSWIKSWACVAKACDNDGDRKPADCLGHFRLENALEESEENKLICDIVQSSEKQTRQTFINTFPGPKGDGFMEGIAYVYASKGDATACQDVIKDYLGPYGPNWNSHWYIDMSGCRILAHESTREQEEEDFSRWLGVLREAGDPCLDIINSELRAACSTPGLKFYSPNDR